MGLVRGRLLVQGKIDANKDVKLKDPWAYVAEEINESNLRRSISSVKWSKG